MVMFAAALWVKTGSVSDPSTCFNNTHYLSFTLWWVGSFGCRPWWQNMNVLVQHMMCFSVLKSQAVSYISMLLKTEHKVTLFLHATGLECNRIPSYHWQDWNPIYHFPLYGTFYVRIGFCLRESHIVKPEVSLLCCTVLLPKASV